MRDRAMKYPGWKELIAAFKAGELKGYIVVLDNDSSYLRPTGEGLDEEAFEEACDDASDLFQGNGYADIEDILKAIGIPCEGA